jgi:hypothetical protein
VAAGGVADCADAVGVDVIFVGVGAEPSDGGFRIMHGGGELIPGCEAIGDGDRDVATVGELFAEGVPAFAVAGAKSAAVDGDDGGEALAFFDLRGTGEV